jgi:hypothetical protein
MTDRLAWMVSVMPGWCGVDAAAIERIDVSADGRLTASVRCGTGRRWLEADESGLRERFPEQDPLLALAAHLPALRAAERVEILSWRPRRRLVLRLDRVDATLVVKGYREQRIARAVERHRLAAELLAGTRLQPPELVAHDSRRHAIVSRFSTGRPLGLGHASQERFFRVGAALRSMQACPVPAVLARHDAAAELAVLDELAARLARVGTSTPARWGEIRSRLDEHRPGAAALVSTHGDLHEGQILEDGDELLLLDFDQLCAADAVLDVANLLVHLKLRSLQGLGGATDESVLLCGRALLDGLDRDDDADFAARLRFYQACAFLRLALRHRLRPAWNALAQPLTALAGRCLDELVRT